MRCVHDKPERSHPHFTLSSDTSPQSNVETRARLHAATDLRLFILTRSTADTPLGFYALFHGHEHRPVYWGLERGHDIPTALWKALLTGMSHVSEFPHTCPLLILLPNRALLPSLTNLGKQRFLPQTMQFTALLDDFITESSPTEVRLFSPKWRNMPYALVLASTAMDPCPPPPPSTPVPRRTLAFRQWALAYDSHIPRRRGPAWLSITRPDGPTPPPFTQGALVAKNRRYFSAQMQLTTRHCFDANYSNQFRPNAGDEVRCPCNFSQHLDGSAVEGRPTRGRTTTEAGSQRNAERRSLDFDALQRLFLDPTALTEEQDAVDPPPRHRQPTHTYHLYTLPHVIGTCSLTEAMRSRFLRNYSIDDMFRSELGSVSLGRFLHFLQALLRPLPPRPDPP